jgi:hypothetical protein
VSVFDVDHVHLDLKGSASGDSVTLTGQAAEAPDLAFQAKLTKISG